MANQFFSILQHSIFFTAVILAMFFYGNKLVFLGLRLIKLKENQEFIAFLILVIMFSSYSALLHEWVIKFLVSLGVIGWIMVFFMYYFFYSAFKKEIKKPIKDISS